MNEEIKGACPRSSLPMNREEETLETESVFCCYAWNSINEAVYRLSTGAHVFSLAFIIARPFCQQRRP